MKGKVAFHSLGCRVNIYETGVMGTAMKNAGYEEVPFAPGADIYVINTCTVTNVADRKSRQMLHRAKEMNPQAVVVAVGCYVEDAGEALLADPAVDVVVGNADKARLPEILETYFQEIELRESGLSTVRFPENAPEPERKWQREDSLCEVSFPENAPEPERSGKQESKAEGFPEKPSVEGHRAFVGSSVRINAVQEYEETPFYADGEHTRAFVKIQDGCNQFCTYCMIPYVRGRVRSRRMEDIVAEVERLSALGFREVVLTGIHVSSYGLDFDAPGRNLQTPPAREAKTNVRLLAVLRAVSEVPGICRIRMGSLEPGIVTEEFAAELAKLPQFCPSFHLSLQSGCDATLARMRRKYTTEDYMRICGILRRQFADAAITTDIIAGFPGETEEEFAATLEFVANVHFARTHIFKYSIRRGTIAARMPGQVPEKVKTERAKRLSEIDAAERSAFARRFLGRELEVLLEEYHEDGGYVSGYTRSYVPVRVYGCPGRPGDIQIFVFTEEKEGELRNLPEE